jgi:hypothetical protein
MRRAFRERVRRRAHGRRQLVRWWIGEALPRQSALDRFGPLADRRRLRRLGARHRTEHSKRRECRHGVSRFRFRWRAFRRDCAG